MDSLVYAINIYKNQPLLFLGEGSNTIFVEDFEGCVLLNKLKGVHVSEDDEFYHLSVASGENWHELVVFCIERGINGFENLALIPGTVGAAPIQNIGAYGVEIERFIHSVEFYEIESGRMAYFNRKECEFAYRESRFKREAGKRIITSVNFVLPKQYQLVTSYGPLAELKEASAQSIFKKVIEIRQQKLPDPSKLGNAGSFFKNPTISMSHFLDLQSRYPDIPHFSAPEGMIKIPAAWLIDTLGFKGVKQGDVGCHQHQALVLVNHGNAKGKDLIYLARDIKQQVANHFNIELENEVRLIGRDNAIEL